MMAKQHFKKFADALATIEDDTERHRLTDWIGGILQEDNPKFDGVRFREWIKRVKNGEDLKGLR